MSGVARDRRFRAGLPSSVNDLRGQPVWDAIAPLPSAGRWPGRHGHSRGLKEQRNGKSRQRLRAPEVGCRPPLLQCPWAPASPRLGTPCHLAERSVEKADVLAQQCTVLRADEARSWSLGAWQSRGRSIRMTWWGLVGPLRSCPRRMPPALGVTFRSVAPRAVCLPTFAIQRTFNPPVADRAMMAGGPTPALPI